MDRPSSTAATELNDAAPMLVKWLALDLPREAPFPPVERKRLKFKKFLGGDRVELR